MGGFLSKSNIVSPEIEKKVEEAVSKVIDDQTASCCSSVSKFSAAIKAKIAFSNCCNNILIEGDHSQGPPQLPTLPPPQVVDVLPIVDEGDVLCTIEEVE